MEHQGDYVRGCRCDDCRESHALRMRRFRVVARYRRKGATHGSYSTYVNYACRCDPCMEAKREYDRTRRVAA